MWESFFGFKKTPFGDCPDAKQMFASTAWQNVNARLEFLTRHPGACLLTGEVGAGKSTAARVFAASLNPGLFKILYVHFSAGSALDLLRQVALALDLEPAHFRGDLVLQIADAVVRLNQGKKQHPILICDEAHLLIHAALEQLPLLLNFDMDSARYLSLLLIGQPLLRRTLSLQVHEALRQRIGSHYHLEGLTRDEVDAYLAQQLKAAGVTQPLFDDMARQGLYQATKGIPRKVNKLASLHNCFNQTHPRTSPTEDLLQFLPMVTQAPQRQKASCPLFIATFADLRPQSLCFVSVQLHQQGPGQQAGIARRQHRFGIQVPDAHGSERVGHPCLADGKLARVGNFVRNALVLQQQQY